MPGCWLLIVIGLPLVLAELASKEVSLFVFPKLVSANFLGEGRGGGFFPSKYFWHGREHFG